VTSPEQHAATVLRALSWEAPTPEPESWGGKRAEARDALDELVALAGRADELERRLSTLGDTTIGLKAIEAVCDRAEAAEARADELQRERDEAWFERVETTLANGAKDYVVWCRHCGTHHQRPEHCPARVQARREADQLQRELRSARKLAGGAKLEWLQARREADQLRAALLHIPQCGNCASGRYQDCQTYTAALAGVQAEEQTDWQAFAKDVVAGDLDAIKARLPEWIHGVQAEERGCAACEGDPEAHGLHVCVQADNKDSA